MMELTKLKYFYIVAKYEHMTKAAEEICIAQPALTKSIKLLEEELGVPLFCKKGRNIVLTPYGLYLKTKLDGIFPLLESIPKELATLREQTKNTVKLNVLAASTIVTNAVVGYKKKNPDAIFHLVQNDQDADCDISVTTSAANVSEKLTFSSRVVMEERIYLAVPKTSKYAGYSSIALAEVKDESFVHLLGSRLFRTVCDRFCAEAGFRPKTAFESDSPAAVRNIIGASAGVGFWPEYSWGKTDELDVKLLPINTPICKRELIIGRHEQPYNSAYAEDFFHYLIGYIRTQKENTEK